MVKGKCFMDVTKNKNWIKTYQFNKFLGLSSDEKEDYFIKNNICSENLLFISKYPITSELSGKFLTPDSSLKYARIGCFVNVFILPFLFIIQRCVV